MILWMALEPFFPLNTANHMLHMQSVDQVKAGTWASNMPAFLFVLWAYLATRKRSFLREQADNEWMVAPVHWYLQLTFVPVFLQKAVYDLERQMSYKWSRHEPTNWVGIDWAEKEKATWALVWSFPANSIKSRLIL